MAYVVGGYGGGKLSSFERYDGTSDTRSAMAPMRNLIVRTVRVGCRASFT